MENAIPVTEARDVLGDVVGRVQYGRERIVLTRHGRPAAAVVPMSDYEVLESIENEIDLADALAAARDPKNAERVAAEVAEAQLDAAS